MLRKELFSGGRCDGNSVMYIKKCLRTFLENIYRVEKIYRVAE